MVVIVGPTAAGKTDHALALALAPDIQGEVISADSRHIYRRMDIGTNKPTPAERAQVPHHLLDLRQPDQSFSLAEYVQMARQAISDIQARGNTPMLVGGTGQYVRAVLEGWRVPEVPPHEAIRQRWLAYEREHGQAALFNQMIALDPAAAHTIDSRNVRRVVRALEVMEVTGETWSALQRREPLNMDIQMHYVNLPRETLYARADARLTRMIEQGWLDECAALLLYLETQSYDYDAAMKLPALSSLGYRELCAVVRGHKTLDEAIAEVKQATRRFIRMQDTWFRKLSGEAGSRQTSLADGHL